MPESSELDIILASGREIEAIQSLWREYWDSLGLPPDFQFAEKLRTLPGAAGYHDMYGDTLKSMKSAFQMYRQIGFSEVIPYSSDPTPGAIFSGFRFQILLN